MLQTVKRTHWVLIAVALAVAMALGADYGFRCHGSPLSRDEALARANARLEHFSKSFNVKEAMTLSDATFEADTKGWLVTFTGPKCKVIIIVDRCHGDDVGSTNGCSG